ncbi:hypothetical protein J6590_084045 [Homalodisca vitripennis]|nr:hypothetical protein J6590_084045 [Homalodisca vitripennis]
MNGYHYFTDSLLEQGEPIFRPRTPIYQPPHTHVSAVPSPPQPTRCYPPIRNAAISIR